MDGGNMVEYKTRYGIIRGIVEKTVYEDGALKECIVKEPCMLKTSLGNLIPKYRYEEVRDKYRNSLAFYPDGSLKSLYMEERAFVQTPLGMIKGELVTFYQNGALHRIFPLYGQISAYWSEEEEYKLAEKIKFPLPSQITLDNSVSCICFYASGAIKSITLWMKNEFITVPTLYGNLKGRIGISFYENGMVKSMEPAAGTIVDTSIGKIEAFDNNPVGIHGDCNSLQFDEEGKIISLITSMTGISAVGRDGKEQIIAPQIQQSVLELDSWIVAAIKITLGEKEIAITDSNDKVQVFSFKDYAIGTFRNRVKIPND